MSNLTAEYAYHFTNFEDFLKIVKSGRLYSRNLAEFHGASFSHNTRLTDKVMSGTDDEIKDYARLALSPFNHAFYHFKNKHGKSFVACEMRFGLDKIYQLPRLRISEGSDQPASKLKFTRELPHLRYEDFSEKIGSLSENEMAELLVFGEVPLWCLSEVAVTYQGECPELGEASEILKNNGTAVIMRCKNA